MYPIAMFLVIIFSFINSMPNLMLYTILVFNIFIVLLLMTLITLVADRVFMDEETI